MSKLRTPASRTGTLVAAALAALAAAPASGQPDPGDQPRPEKPRRERAERGQRADEQRRRTHHRRPRDNRPDDGDPYWDDAEYRSEPPYDYYERHWRRQSRDYARSRRRFSRRRHGRWYSDRPGWRRYDRGHYDDDAYPPRYDYGYYDGYDYGGPAFDEGYWEGRRDGRRFAEWEQRYELGRQSYVDAMSEGLLAFRNAEYSKAVLGFIRAAKLNQGDPASRIHAAHAMVAIGRYHEALPALRRAFQLQPKIAYLSMDIRRDYGPKADFDAHLKQLAAAAREADDDPALWLLLGYYRFYSGRESGALASLRKAADLAPGDFMTEALLNAARMVAPAPKHAPKAGRGDREQPNPERRGKARPPQDV